MLIFVRSALWAIVACLCVIGLQAIAQPPVALAQDEYWASAKAEGGETAEDPRMYWKCWRSPSMMGEGFTNQMVDAGGVIATPDLPSTAQVSGDHSGDSAVNEEGNALPASDGRHYMSPSQLVAARFYRDPGLRTLPDPDEPGGVGKPFNQARLGASLPAGFDPDDAYFAAQGSGARFSASVVPGEESIDSVTTVWQTHSGAAGSHLLDPVKVAQQEQAADQEISEHVVSRQTAYQGSGRVVNGRLDPHGAVHNVGELGGDLGVGLRLDTGTQEVPVTVISGTTVTTTSGTTTTTQHEVGSRPALVSAETSTTSRNSPTLPEVNQQSVTVAQSEPELRLVATTGIVGDGSAAPTVSDVDTETLYPSGMTPVGPFANSPVRTGIQMVPAPGLSGPVQRFPAPGCFVASETTSSRNDGNSAELRVYCWMVRSGSTPSAVGATREVSVSAAQAPGGADFTTMENPGGQFSHLSLPPGTTTIEIPEYERDPAQAAQHGVLTANTPAERADGLAPDVVDDSPNDAILVTLNLKEEHRRDPQTNYTPERDVSGSERFRWKLFREELYPPLTRTTAGGGYVQTGYQQPYLLPPFWGIGDDEKERLVPYLYDRRDPVVSIFGADTIFRWPVRLDELNYYLFRAPGFTKGHASGHKESLGHVWNLTHAYATGPDALLGASQHWSHTAVPTGSLMADPRPDPVAVAVPAEVEGTSKRTDFLGFGSWHVNPFTKGQAYLPIYDAHAYWDLVDKEYAGYEDYVLTGRRSYTDGSGDTYAVQTLGRNHLVKAGVAAPTDRGSGADGYGTNARFQFAIEEGVPSASQEGDTKENVLKRLGFSTGFVSDIRVDQNPVDPFGSNPKADSVPAVYGNNWPNSRINPDETHVLLVTFYEGRKAHRWRVDGGELRERPTGGADDPNWLMAGVNAGVGGVKDLGARASAALFEGETNLRLAAVPTFQYRRVMCRIIIAPEGTVLPASGIEGLGNRIENVWNDAVAAITGWIGKLLAWLEDAPRKSMHGVAEGVRQGSCQGAGFMGSLGDQGTVGVSPASQAVRGNSADIELSHIEANDLQGKADCDAAAQGLDQHGAGAPLCDDVELAVGDPRCSGVPAVDFTLYPWREHSGIDHRWNFVDVSGSPPTFNPSPTYSEDVRLYPDHSYASAYDQVGGEGFEQLGIPIAASIRADLGYPTVRIHLPHPVDRTGGSLSEDDPYLATFPDADEVTRDPSYDVQDTHDINEVVNAASILPYNGFVLYVRPDPKASGFSYASYEDIQSALHEYATEPGSYGVPGPYGVPGFDLLLKAPVSELKFVLPLYYVQRSTSPDKAVPRRIRSFEMGAVTLHREQTGTVSVPTCRDNPLPVMLRYHEVADRKRFGGGHEFLSEHPDTDPGRGFQCADGVSTGEPWQFYSDQETVAFIGKSDWSVLESYLTRLWFLGDGFEYEFALAAYRGWPGFDDGFVEGPRSEWTKISGGASLACTDIGVMAAINPNMHSEAQFNSYVTGRYTTRSGGLDHAAQAPSLAQATAVAEHYGCADLLAPGGRLSHHGEGSVKYEEVSDGLLAVSTPPPRVLPTRGVLGAQVAPDLSGLYRASHLFGPSACGSLWNGTPSSLTWDSPIVKSLWHVSWVLALLIFFIVLVWDGIGVTYDGMIGDGRGGSALRSMFPRFALALLLAALSLFICRIGLTLVADLTCFISHATGMTFWGFLGSFLAGTIGLVVQTFLTPAGLFGGFDSGALFANSFLVLLLLMLIVVVFYGIKLFFGMVGRIVLLLVLCGLSPIAFAMFASPSTAHWTKRWVSMFLGTAVQQIAVLLVLYAGASLGKHFLPDGGASSIPFWNTFLQLLMMMMTVFLASKVPDVVNPASKGLMSGFGQMMAMVAAAGMMVASGGIGAIAGAAAGPGSLNPATAALTGAGGQQPLGNTPPGSTSNVGTNPVQQSLSNAAPDPGAGPGVNPVQGSSSNVGTDPGGTPTVAAGGGGEQGGGGGGGPSGQRVSPLLSASGRAGSGSGERSTGGSSGTSTAGTPTVGASGGSGSGEQPTGGSAEIPAGGTPTAEGSGGSGSGEQPTGGSAETPAAGTPTAEAGAGSGSGEESSSVPRVSPLVTASGGTRSGADSSGGTAGTPTAGTPAAGAGGSDPDGAAAAQAAAAQAGAQSGGKPSFGSRLGGFLDRAARGAYYGAARGQNMGASLQNLSRTGNVGSIPMRGYTRSQPGDNQSFRDYVNRVQSPEPDRGRRGNSGQGPTFGQGYGNRDHDYDGHGEHHPEE